MEIEKNFHKEIRKRYLSSFSERTYQKALWVSPKDDMQLLQSMNIARKSNRPVLVRGGGHSYGDMILCSGGVLVDNQNLAKIIHWDSETGILRCSGGTLLLDIYRKCLAENWYLHSAPGAPTVTIGGAISNNVHGKDSWLHGNFASSILAMRILLANGEYVDCSPSQRSDLFNAVVGGLGLLGVIIDVTLQLKKVPSPFIQSKIVPAKNISHLIELVHQIRNDNADFLMGWIDFQATGKSCGRSLVNFGHWASKAECKFDYNVLEERLARQIPTKIQSAALPYVFKPTTFKLFNIANYNAHKWFGRIGMTRKLETFVEYNFWSHRVPDTKDLCGSNGFYEIHVAAPTENFEDMFLHLHSECQRSKNIPIMSVFKPFRRDEYPLSFSTNGFGFTMEFSCRGFSGKEMNLFIRKLITLVIRFKGKVYLAKDEYLNKEEFFELYPRATEFWDIKQKYDPNLFFYSDMAKRFWGERDK